MTDKLPPVRELTDQLYLFIIEMEDRRDRDNDEMWTLVPPPEWMHLERHVVVAWRVREIEEMTKKLNELRSTVGADPLSESKVHEVEMQAAGHVDYGRKFALYCAELVHDIKPRFY